MSRQILHTLTVTKKLQYFSLPICLIWLTIIAWPHSGTSQSQYSTGFYITLENDTVKGLIDDRGGTSNFKTCTFKADKSSKKETFLPHQINAYRLENGKFYVSKTISIDSESKEVFAEYLVNGISDLYLFRDQNHYLYIIENESGEMVEIERGRLPDPKIQKFIDPNIHIRELKAAFADCMEIQPKIENSNITHKSLINLTKEYHNYVCDDYECIVYEKKSKAIAFYFSPVLGMAWSNLSFDYEFFSLLRYDRNANADYGVQVDVPLLFINRDLALQSHIAIGRNDYVGKLNEAYQIDILNRRLQTALLIKYTFPFRFVKPSIGIGVHGDLLRNVQVITEVKGPINANPNDITPEAFAMTYSLLGAVAQLGLNFNILPHRDIFTNFRYTVSGGVSLGNYGSVNTTVQSYSIGFGFTVNKVR